MHTYVHIVFYVNLIIDFCFQPPTMEDSDNDMVSPSEEPDIDNITSSTDMDQAKL